MQKILIDKFIVPEESNAPFLERAHKVQSLLKTLPGFIEGFLYEKRDGESRYQLHDDRGLGKMRKPSKTQRKQSPRNSKSKVSVFRTRKKTED